jgi:hypothetical protein
MFFLLPGDPAALIRRQGVRAAKEKRIVRGKFVKLSPRIFLFGFVVTH